MNRSTGTAMRWGLAAFGACTALFVPEVASAAPIGTVDRYGAFVSVEPYAPDIVRVTIATGRDRSVAAPGYGIVAKADQSGWVHCEEAGERLPTIELYDDDGVTSRAGHAAMLHWRDATRRLSAAVTSP